MDPTTPAPDAAVHPLAFTAPLGGVSTREVGTISGEVEVWFDPAHAGCVKIRYVGALEDYTVLGTAAGRTLEEVAAVLTEGRGVDKDGNPAPTDLLPAPVDGAPR